MRAWIAGLWMLLALGAGAARAADVAAAEHWRALTRADVEAAFALLRDNHPGAAAEADDPAFAAALARAHAQALERAGAVEGYEGYVAALGAFAGGLEDGHIGSGPRFLPRTVRWAGLIAARRGEAWVVAGGDPAVAGGDFIGARILDCDGQPADVRARTALSFRADATSAATQVLQGVWLLVDEGNPFLPAPHACTLDRGGQTVTVTLHWAAIDRSVLLTRWWKRPYGAAGFDVRASGPGFWIGLQALDPRAQPVLDAVKAQAAAMRAAPYVVVDLRGDGGGDDGYAYRLGEALYGPEHVAAVLGASGSTTADCPPIFRASPDNIAAFTRQIALFEAGGDAEGARAYEKAVAAMNAARASGHALTGEPVCHAPTAPALRAKAAVPPSAMRGRVFVLTDAACFSSCLQAVEFFRHLGAVQLGQPTGADTHFSEYRQITLPSGLSTFSTLSAMMPAAPRRIGPYTPERAYEGDIADTAALEAWVRDSVVGTAQAHG